MSTEVPNKQPVPLEIARISSDRSFALVFACLFGFIALWPWIRGQGNVVWWLLAVAGAFAVLGIAAPRALHPLNLLWYRLGMLLNRLMTPVVLGMLFLVVVTPIALIYRATGKDPLRLKRNRQDRSYWILREPPGPPPKSMTNQY